VIDVGGSGQDRSDQGEDLAAGTRATDSTGHAHQLVHQRFEAQVNHEGDRHDQTGIGHEAGIVEGHPDALDRAR
jgi:hypothetical protein